MRDTAYSVALCGLFAALGAAVMLAAGLIPILTYCLPLAASLFLIPVLYEFGKGRAWMTWIVTAALAAILCGDKEAAFFYAFLGYYPIVKPTFDKLGRVGFAVKLLFFAAVVTGMYALIVFVLGLDVEIERNGFLAALCAALTAVMLLFDYALRRMFLLYVKRIRPAVFKKPR